MQIHGGEGKTKDTKLDFSVNISPLGMPNSVREAFHSMFSDPSAMEEYPDRACVELRRAAGAHYRVPEDWIVCGCGASELIYKIAYLYRGCRALVLSPGFGEYGKALREAGCSVRVLELKKERDFAFDEDFFERFCRLVQGGGGESESCSVEEIPGESESCSVEEISGESESCFVEEIAEESKVCFAEEISKESEPCHVKETAGKSNVLFSAENSEEKEVDLIFLCSPNNPVGGRIPEEMLKKMLELCVQRRIRVVVDECFLPFVTGEEPTVDFLKERAKRRVEKSQEHGKEDFESADTSLIILKALTKSHAIPGVRLGLAISSDTELIRQMQESGAPWTVSGIAAKLGKAAFEGWDEEEFRAMRKTVAQEREYLVSSLTEAGAKVYPGEGNFILFSVTTGKDLFEFMRGHGILIRSCESFGLGTDFYRIAVRTKEENRIFCEVFHRWKIQPNDRKLV